MAQLSTGQVVFLKALALLLGTAVDFMLWGSFFKSPEFQVHPGVESEQPNLLLFGTSESRKGLPRGARSVVNV